MMIFQEQALRVAGSTTLWMVLQQVRGDPYGPFDFMYIINFRLKLWVGVHQ